MRKVKIFSKESDLSLESAINDWFTDNEHAEITDMKFASAAIEGSIFTSVMIVYNEPAPHLPFPSNSIG